MPKRKRSKSDTQYFRTRFPSPSPTSNVSDSATSDAAQLVSPTRTSHASCSQENIPCLDFASGKNPFSVSQFAVNPAGLELGSERYPTAKPCVTLPVQLTVPSFPLSPLSDPAGAENQPAVLSIPPNQPPNVHISRSSITVVEGNMRVVNYMEPGPYLKTCIVLLQAI